MKELLFNLDGNLIPALQDGIMVSEIASIVDSLHTACPYELVLKYSIPGGTKSPDSLMKAGSRAHGTQSSGFEYEKTESPKEYSDSKGFCKYYKGVPFLCSQTGDKEKIDKVTKTIVEYISTGKIDLWRVIPEKYIQTFSIAYFLAIIEKVTRWNIEIRIDGQTLGIFNTRYDHFFYMLQVESWLDKCVDFYTGKTLVESRVPCSMPECGTCEDNVKMECKRRWKNQIDLQ